MVHQKWKCNYNQYQFAFAISNSESLGLEKILSFLLVEVACMHCEYYHTDLNYLERGMAIRS